MIGRAASPPMAYISPFSAVLAWLVRAFSMGATGFQAASFNGKHQAWVVDQVSVLVPREPPARERFSLHSGGS